MAGLFSDVEAMENQLEPVFRERVLYYRQNVGIS
jgi:hypothetical protein